MHEQDGGKSDEIKKRGLWKGGKVGAEKEVKRKDKRYVVKRKRQ